MYKNNLQEPEVVRYLNSEIQRYHIINHLIDKYKLVNYLEIGVFKGENIREIKAAHKDGVDPGVEGYVVPEVNYPMTSDAFFDLIKEHEEIKYDIIFIDGLHHADQVTKDIKNSLKHLVSNGFIVMHDCNPVSYEAQLIPRETVAWNGDTWKAFVDFKAHYPNVKCCVVDTDFGVGVIQNNPNKVTTLQDNFWNWEYFNSNRKQLLNLITWDEFKATY
jgi:hypothetical protein